MVHYPNNWRPPNHTITRNEQRENSYHLISNPIILFFEQLMQEEVGLGFQLYRLCIRFATDITELFSPLTIRQRKAHRWAFKSLHTTFDADAKVILLECFIETGYVACKGGFHSQMEMSCVEGKLRKLNKNLQVKKLLV